MNQDEGMEDAVVFIKYDDRYEFLDASGSLVRTMTQGEFEAWKAKNPLSK